MTCSWSTKDKRSEIDGELSYKQHVLVHLLWLPVNLQIGSGHHFDRQSCGAQSLGNFYRQ